MILQVCRMFPTLALQRYHLMPHTAADVLIAAMTVAYIADSTTQWLTKTVA